MFYDSNYNVFVRNNISSLVYVILSVSLLATLSLNTNTFLGTLFSKAVKIYSSFRVEDCILHSLN
jgi:hypothetical protein